MNADRITWQQAADAIESLDDCANMTIGVDASGPRELLYRFLEQCKADAALAAQPAQAVQVGEPVATIEIVAMGEPTVHYLNAAYGLPFGKYELCVRHRNTVTAQEAKPAVQGEDVEPEPLFYGRWHHGQGHLNCGTMRYMRADFDTQPAPEVREAIFDWICATMNAALDRWHRQRDAARSLAGKQGER